MTSREERDVIAQINLLARNAGYRRHRADLPKIRVLLEACGPGNAALAAQLYWDDFVATRALDDNDHDNDNDEAAEDAAAPARDEEADAEIAAAAAPPPRKTRRTRGAGGGRRGGGGHRPNHSSARDPPQQDEASDAPDDDDVIIRDDHIDDADRMIVEPEPHNASARRSLDAATAARKRPPPPRRLAVTDDPAVQRLVARAKATLQAAAAAKNDVPQRPESTVLRDEIALRIEREKTTTPAERRPIARAGFMAEEDWVWHAVDHERERIPSSQPSSALWGEATTPERSEDEDENEPEPPVTAVPLTWLRVGFQLDPETALGLVLTPPSDTDLGYEEWQLTSIKRKKKNRPAPPFYCRAVTAVLSIVTALLHSGARVESNAITSQPEKTTPWLELTVTERKRQFETRLARALACLLHRAATVARTRRLRYLESTRCEDEQRLRRQRAKRKIRRVCPVLGWPMDGDTQVLPAAGKTVSYASSFANIEDLHLYASSQMEHFQKPGGVALLLETLAKIHGNACLQELLGEAKSPHSSLVHCDCLQRDEQANQQAAKPAGDTPHCNCCGVELVSLLLTGTIHTNWQGWSADPMDFGFLTDRAVLSKSLTRPMKPIWVMLGPTVFSVLTTSAHHPDQEQETSGRVVRLEHWNTWYDDRNLTKLRLSMGRHEWKPPRAEPAPVGEGELAGSQTLLIIEERRRRRCRIQEEREGLEVTDPNAVFSVVERAAVEPHPDDVSFYPDRFQLWRYDTSHWPVEGDNDVADSKPRGRWVPFHRLTIREKRLVEASMGPAICNILRTRWPSATLDALEPARPFPVV